MIDQPFNEISILGEGSEPVGSTPTLDFNSVGWANQVVMFEESDDDSVIFLGVNNNNNNKKQRKYY
jgi:hypothetical protein